MENKWQKTALSWSTEMLLVTSLIMTAYSFWFLLALPATLNNLIISRQLPLGHYYQYLIVHSLGYLVGLILISILAYFRRQEENHDLLYFIFRLIHMTILTAIGVLVVWGSEIIY